MTKKMTQPMTKTNKSFCLSHRNRISSLLIILRQRKIAQFCARHSQSVSLSWDGRLFLFFGLMMIPILLPYYDFRAVVVIMLGS